MDAYNRLAKNTLIFTIANISSQVVAMLMIPYYTYMLTTEEMGTVDAVVSIVSLISPIITLYFQDAVMRFCMEKNADKTSIFSTAMVTVATGSIFVLVFVPVLLLLSVKKSIICFLFLLIVIQGLNGILGQFAKVIDKNVSLAISGVASTFVMVFSNIIFLTVFDLKIEGYLLSILIANFVAVMYLFITCRAWRYIDISTVNKDRFLKMLRYSLPLIPNAIMWWIVNLSDRYMIIGFIGLGANGIYAVASKIPSLMNMVNGMFNQAWQISAIEERHNDKRNEFASNVINMYILASVLVVLLVLGVIRPLIEFGIAESFVETWHYIPFLMYAMMFSGFGAFLGSIYAAEKKTKRALYSTLWSAGTNIVLNLVLIPTIGIQGAGLATFISMIVLFGYRMVDTREFIKIDYDKKMIITSILVLFIQLICYYKSSLLACISLVCMLAIVLYVNKRYIAMLLYKVAGRFIKDKKYDL